MKYSNKEKQKHFAELRNPETAAADLDLLRQKSPEQHSIIQFSRNPKRYADDILYALLDFASRDEIRNNRRQPEELTPTPNPEEELAKKEAEERAKAEELVNKESAEKAESEKQAESEAAKDRDTSETENNIEESEAAKEEAEERVAEAEERAEESEAAKEEAEERATEAEERAEEAEERAEKAEIALEQEKKKVNPTPNPKVVNSKSKKSIPKSTGTTSSTRKSKQPPSSTTTE